MSKIIHNIGKICNCLDKAKIPHIVSGPSLIGLNLGNITKYTNKVELFIFNYSPFSILYLFFILLVQGMLLKPKIRNKRLHFKVRKKMSLLSKNPEFFKLIIGREKNENYVFFNGGRFISFKKEDLKKDNITKYKIESNSITVPKDINSFIKKYEKNILANYYKKYPVMLKGKSEKKAIKMLEDVTEILKSSKCSYWLDAGTLLGAIRDGKLIPWDHDLDIGVQFSTNSDLKNLIHSLQKQFYVRALAFSKKEGIWNLGKYRIIKVYNKKAFFFRQKLCLDIFIFYREPIQPGSKIVYKYGVWDQNAYYDSNLIDNLKDINFYGRNYNIPGDSHEYLKAKYGESWKTPKKIWNVVLDDKSISR